MRALDSAIGFPSRPTSASSMLGLLMPEEVRRSFMLPPGVVTAGENVLPLRDPYAVETGRPPKTHRLRRDPASQPQGSFRSTGPDGNLDSRPGYRIGEERRSRRPRRARPGE